MCSRSDKTNFDSFFMALIDLSFFCCYFALELLCISSTIGWRVKGTLKIKILVLSLPELEFCPFRTPEIFSKTQNCAWLWGLLTNFIHCMSRLDNKPQNTFLKNWAKNLGLADNLVFQSKNIVVELFFPELTKPQKWQKICDLGFIAWLFFVAVRSHKQPMHGCSLEPSLLLNFFMWKDFIVQMFRKWCKNLPNCLWSLIHILLDINNVLLFLLMIIWIGDM